MAGRAQSVMRGHNVSVDLIGAEDVYRALGELQSKAPAVIKVTVNATAREARKLMIQRAKARYAVNSAGLRHLKDLAQTKKATNKNTSAELSIQSPLADFGYFEHNPTQEFTGRDVFRYSPDFYRGHVLKGAPLKPFSGESSNYSKGFVLKFKSGHVGIVQRDLNKPTRNTVTQRNGRPRWRNKRGFVETLRTVPAPSAAAMHSTIWPLVSDDVEAFMLQRLDMQIDKVIERNKK